MEEQSPSSQVEALIQAAEESRRERARQAAEWRERLCDLAREANERGEPERTQVLGALYWRSDPEVITAGELAASIGTNQTLLRQAVASVAPLVHCACGRELRRAASRADERKGGRCGPCGVEAQRRKEAERQAQEAAMRKRQLAEFEAAGNRALTRANGLCVVCQASNVQAYLRAGVHWEHASGADFTVLCPSCREALNPRAQLREAAAVTLER